MKSEHISQDELKQILHYDPETGVFTWLQQLSIRAPVGRIAGSKQSRGYFRIRIKGENYKSHRLAFFYVHGYWPQYVDHINNDPADNRIANLRPATKSENAANSKRRRDNRSGYKGVSWDKTCDKWVARLAVNGEQRKIGYYLTAEEAYEAYCAESRKHFGEFARAA